MKRVRLLILTGLIIAALALVAVPAFAGPPYPVTELNSSFEGDKDGDNIPDKWNVKGDVLRVCDHQYASADNCMMVFKPSDSKAAVWQTLSPEGWKVVTEEAMCVYMDGYTGMMGLDSDRAYVGYNIHWADGSSYTLYAAHPGGTHPIDFIYFYWDFPDCNPTIPDPVQMRWGVLSFPGDGYLGVDGIRIVQPGP